MMEHGAQEISLSEASLERALQSFVDAAPVLDERGVTFMFEGAGGYHIEWSRLRTRTQLLGWVKHLAPKAWMNGLRLSRFVEMVSEYRGWRIDPLP